MPEHPQLSRMRALISSVLLVLSVSGCASLSLLQRPAPPPAAEPVVVARPQWEAPTPAGVASSSEEQVERLLRLSRVWHAVRWFHPDIADAPGAWDTAYLKVIDRARTAESDAAFAQAVQGLLSELRDAESRVVRDSSSRRMPRAAIMQAPAPGTVLDLRVPATLDSLRAAPPPAGVRMADLRSTDGVVHRRVARAAVATSDVSAGSAPIAAGELSWLLTTEHLYRPVSPPAASTDDGRRGARTTSPIAVLLVDDDTRVPAPLMALHALNEAVIVSAGSGLVNTDADVLHLPLGNQYYARVRLSDVLMFNGSASASVADTTVPTMDNASRAAVVETARQIASGSTPLPRDRRASDSFAKSSTVSRLITRASVMESAAAVEEGAYPSHPERLLAVTQLWGTVRTYNPYIPIADELWDDAFRRTVTAVERARNAREYADAMIRFAAAMDGAQVEVSVPDHPEFWSRAGRVPFGIRMAQRRFFVTVIDDSARARSGVNPGDELLSIGGETIDKRLERWRPLMPSSNPWSRDAAMTRWLEHGPQLVKSTYRVRTPSGVIQDVEFQYSGTPTIQTGLAATSHPEHVRTEVESMTGGIVRVRPVRGRGTPVPGMATPLALPPSVAEAQGIIVDLLSAPSEALQSWLAGSPLDAIANAYAREERAILHEPPQWSLLTPETDPARNFARRLHAITSPATAGMGYTGPVAIVIDATTRGEGELLALRLMAGGRNRVLLGSPTAGAVGERAMISLAGGIRVWYPVSDIRQSDGRLIQRLGIQPTISAQPTVTGIRNGQDDVLLAAQRWLAQQLTPNARRR